MRKLFILLLVFVSTIVYSQDFEKLNKGNTAINFTLKTISGDKVKLSKLNKKSPVVLIVVRGWPEYQCPVCSRQVGQFLAEAEKFQELNTKVLMVYPGPSNVLQEKAKEFTEDFDFPKNFYFTLDPDYSMINKYGLRWDAPKETAYPSTFVVNKKGIIEFSKISTTHRGRADVEEVLEALGKL